jgi:hypothetical protein
MMLILMLPSAGEGNSDAAAAMGPAVRRRQMLGTHVNGHDGGIVGMGGSDRRRRGAANGVCRNAVVYFNRSPKRWMFRARQWLCLREYEGAADGCASRCPCGRRRELSAAEIGAMKRTGFS